MPLGDISEFFGLQNGKPLEEKKYQRKEILKKRKKLHNLFCNWESNPGLHRGRVLFYH